MIHIAWLACALLGAARARLYERCELARDLQALGVRTDHLATWVCIAWHESRFDTAANNPYSGDHGLFQISELYWCGAGKACGIPCHALRDDDISNDLQCALQVHEEHTRLQGDGFQAWVVYPQHCKGNNKKYLIDCEIRSGFSRTSVDSNVHSAFRTTARTQQNNPNIDNLLPPYLLISSIFRERYGKVLDQDKIDWVNYRYDKVDELKLPVLNSRVNEVDQEEYRKIVPKLVEQFIPNITTTTSTTTYIPPVKPWRFIETNQFRKKATPPPTTTAKTATIRYESFAQKITARPVYSASSTQSPTTRNKLPFEKYTVSSSYSPITSLSTVTRDTLQKLKSTTASNKSPTVSTKPVNVTNAAYELPTYTTSFKTSTSPTTSWFKFSTPSWQLRTSTTTSRPVTSYVPFFRTTRTTTVRPTFLAPVTLTSKPSLKPWTVKNQSAFSTKPTATTTSVASTAKTAMKKTIDALTYRAQGYTSTSRTSKVPTTTIIPEVYRRTTSPPSTTPQLQVYTSRSTIAPSTRKSSRTSSPSIKSVQRSTQSIWDLYLNPTKPPKYQPFDFSRGSNKKLNIFSRGTTTASPA